MESMKKIEILKRALEWQEWDELSGICKSIHRATSYQWLDSSIKKFMKSCGIKPPKGKEYEQHWWPRTKAGQRKRIATIKAAIKRLQSK